MPVNLLNIKFFLSFFAVGNCRISCLETLYVGSKPMVALSLGRLPGDDRHIVLATGGLDHKVHLYCGDSTGKVCKLYCNFISYLPFHKLCDGMNDIIPTLQFFHACELKGHTDWIRSLDFSLPVCVDNGEKSLFLVSSSQDRSIRIWKMALHVSTANSKVPYREEDIGLASYIEGPVLVTGSSSYQVSLESLLVGHEDWVYSVQWQPPLPSSVGECQQPMSILSTSMDKTMMIWRPEKTTGIWVNMVTVGELSHSALGFYGGHWAPDGNSILSHGYGGSFHLWRNTGMDYENWQPQKVPSGHYASVSDISWAKSGEYLLSVSHDQVSLSSSYGSLLVRSIVREVHGA